MCVYIYIRLFIHCIYVYTYELYIYVHACIYILRHRYGTANKEDWSTGVCVSTLESIRVFSFLAMILPLPLSRRDPIFLGSSPPLNFHAPRGCFNGLNRNLVKFNSRIVLSGKECFVFRECRKGVDTFVFALRDAFRSV